MEVKISKKVKDSILRDLLKEDIFINFFAERNQLLEFLSEVFPLSEMPSEDQRHKDALGDLSRHLVVNDDWDIDYLFKDRLKLNEIEDVLFIKFIEFFISPKYQQKIDNIHYLVTFFTGFLENESLKFILTGYENNLPIYQLSSEVGAIKNLPKDVKKNDIVFFKKETSGFPNKITNHSKPDIFPSLVLTKDAWDDFGATTTHHLFYHINETDVSYIGVLKIMKRGENSTSLEKQFFLLDETYCSLGTEESFYKNLNLALGSDFISVLFALRDAAFFPMIYEEFEDDLTFKESLIREDRVERNSRTVSYTFGGGDLDERYKFKFKFKPLFDDSETEVYFPFTSTGEVPKRIIALIGKNGTGKTQLLSSLAKNLQNRGSSLFFPKTPVFGKVLAVSYSVFDTFEIPTSDNSFNYKYCGLKDKKGRLLSEVDLEKRFYASIEKIERKKRTPKLNRVLKNFIDQEIIELFIDDENKDVDLKNYSSIKQKLSSGQSLLLYIVVEIIAELRYDSLLLFDEPETHLHPNAITELISAIYNLVEEFDSYCIIATHSPIIVQSLTSDSVYVTEKEGGIFSIRKINKESFGENLTNITDEIFGNINIDQEYKKIIQILIESGKDYEEIISTLETDRVPLSLNAKLYIRSMVKK